MKGVNGMLKVLLVDDEPLLLERLTGLLSWKQHGYELLPAAINGRQALRQMEENQPDIIIADVEMPVMNGLELCSAVKKKWGAAIKVIILTAYSDFQYMQESIGLGVDRYILKNELDAKLLLKLLNEMSDKIESERAKNRHQVLQGLVSGYLPSDFEVTGIYKGFKLVLMLICEKQPLFAQKGKAGSSYLLNENAIREALEGSITEGTSLLETVGMGNNTWGILISVDSFSTLYLHTIVEQIARQIRYRLKKEAGFDVWIMASITGETVMAVANALKKSYETANAAPFYGNRNVLWCRNIPLAKEPVPPHILLKDFSALREACSRKDSETIQEIMKSIRSEFLEEPYNRLSLDTLLDNFWSLFLSLAPEMIDEESDEKLGALTDVDKTWSWITARLIEASNHGTGVRQYSGRISKAVQYIETHYREKLTAADVAKQVDLSEIYFGVLFKKEVGMTFLEYLLQWRTKKAIGLLKNTDMKIYEIAEATGYASSHYFATSFKKATGLKPLEYRNGGKYNED